MTRSKKRICSASIQPYPKARHIVSDLIAEGRRKNGLYVVFDVDLTMANQALKRYVKQHRKPVSLLTYLIQVFAKTVSEQKILQTYRCGQSKMATFHDVDVAVTVEREVDGAVMPIFHIVRDADHASLLNLAERIQYAKTAPLDARPRPFSRTIRRFSKLPHWLRRMVWAIIRRRPSLIKRYMGTVAVTSTNHLFSGNAVFVCPCPVTLLSVGGGGMQMVLIDGVQTERYIVQMALTVDHDVLDGAPVARFIERFKQLLQQPEVIDG